MVEQLVVNREHANETTPPLPEEEEEPWGARLRTLTRLGRHREAVALLRSAAPRHPRPALAVALPSAVISSASSPPPTLTSSPPSSPPTPASPSSPCPPPPRLRGRPAAYAAPSTLLTAYNALISGYALHNLAAPALVLFRRLRLSSAPSFDSVTLLALVPAAPPCLVPALHALALRSGALAPAPAPAVANCLLSAYARAGAVDLARRVFDEIPDSSRDLISWNAMISAYAQHGLAPRVLDLYRLMLAGAVAPDAVTLVGVLSSCAHLGARDFGRGVARCVAGEPSLASNTHLNNALINFHARCGELGRAREVFDEMPRRTVVSWTALIAGYGAHGHGNAAIELFERMQVEGIKPDGVAMVSVLSACSHAGLTDKGLNYFSKMKKAYRIEPNPEHYACMVDLLGRAGRLEDARKLIETMPTKADGAVWGALLGACKIHKNVEIGELAFDRVVELEPTNVGYYVLLSNIYSDSGRLDGVARIRAMMRQRGLKKEPGCSHIELKGMLHLFMADDHSHPQAKRIYELVAKLERLVSKNGDREAIVKGEKGKAPLTGFHSERLAVAFGILNTEDRDEIVVMKNLRVCEDCHSFLKSVSMIAGRSFLIRDASRFHRFAGGQCSCKDYW
ncbi:putative pentatricopeptide repeat-containing protein [Ananas comosus]|uniref:Putative pentatricopeptide repeat-containing protein n=1 Tax=Ananas comosus TaxID=4615 RepID=A0A199URI8_ANACO|nr:putative pentatricopeptide repeat-containing protein [Ananas comosus]